MTDSLRRRVFWTATGLIALEGALFTLVIPALPGFVDRYGLSTSTAALMFASFPIAQLGAALAAAGPVERWGRRPVMVAATLLLALATGGFALADSALLLTAARTVQGLAAGLVWTAAVAAVSDIYPQEQLGYRIGLLETFGGSLALLGPVLGGVLISLIGVNATFGLAAILPLLFIFPALRIPETATRGREPQPLLAALRRLAREPAAQAGAIALASAAAVLALLEPLLPIDLSDRLGLGAAAIGAVFAAGFAAFVLGAPIAGRWSDQHGRRPPILLGGLVIVVTLPFTAVGPAAVVAAAFFAVGLGVATLAAPAAPLLTEAVDRAGMGGRYGISAAVLTVIFAAGYSLGPLIGAAASAVLPYSVIVAGLGVAVLACSVLAYRLLDPARRGDGAAASGGALVIMPRG